MPPPDLTTRRHRQTRDDIAEAAIELFLARGFDETTMDDVAGAAGVSRRTAYRHFANKEDLVFEQPRLWLERFVEVIANRRDHESTRDLLRRGLLSVAELIQDNRQAVLAGYSVLVATPSLLGRHGKSDAEWRGLCAEIVAADLPSDPAGVLQTAVTAGALIGTINGLIVAWAAGQPDADMPTMTAEALDQIDSVWPARSR